MARLTTGARKALPKSEFALPGRQAYPVPDPAHARNALARVSQFGSSGEKAAVRAKVRAKFPSIGQSKPLRARKKPPVSSGPGNRYDVMRRRQD